MKKIRSFRWGYVAGILAGVGIAPIVFAQQSRTTETTSPGDPYIYDGFVGSRATGRSVSGRFNSIQQVGMEIIRFIEVILVPLIMSMALLVFVWGILKYIHKGGDPAERAQGRQFMIYGVIGLAVMASVWGLVRILTNTLGVPLGIPTLNEIQ